MQLPRSMNPVNDVAPEAVDEERRGAEVSCGQRTLGQRHVELQSVAIARDTGQSDHGISHLVAIEERQYGLGRIDREAVGTTASSLDQSGAIDVTGVARRTIGEPHDRGHAIDGKAVAVHRAGRAVHDEQDRLRYWAEAEPGSAAAAWRRCQNGSSAKRRSAA
jgi:hypothetical protein